ncbi:unnamed protein product, partial [Soboliphyme baturini]|uniref:AWS domain-containing protein n=1 Tax=Soboliphyme baturini TaxID=241478 RepID=A0A183IGD1_9BILA
THTCFICLEPGDVVPCSIERCLKFYHKKCVKKYTAAIFDEEDESTESPSRNNKDLICPLHFCASCVAWKRQCRFSSRVNFVYCLKCPTAYHLAEQCIPAGTRVLNNRFIICTNHSDPELTRVSVNYCFVCGKGNAEVMGAFRWWPAQILHPLNIPDNIERLLNKRGYIGEFAVLFYGTHDYGVVSQGRVFQFDPEDKNSCVKRSGLDKAFAAAVLEGQEALKIKTMQEDFLPPVFKFIQSNRFAGGKKQQLLDLNNYPVCHCGSNNSSYCEELCENRSMLVECHPKLCPSGEKCRNQRFQKCEYAFTIPFKTANRGWGLRALEDIAKVDFHKERQMGK